MNFADLIGQTLDEKYKIERELGRGGMGTVYLATHLGTERPVAVKVISPQFMQRPEFVERFRREARAAGRLRHPNVVDVTDFGFADIPQGRVAYLVMEYLDGCTLGEILDEEKNLPVGWTLDILEQVCSAVHEAHSQGIIHRDLKPDNIWLEPNQRGGYTVKVLDFGIAKLEAHSQNGTEESIHLTPPMPTRIGEGRNTVVGKPEGETMLEGAASTVVSESATHAGAAEAPTMIVHSGTGVDTEPDSEKGTAIMDPAEDPDDGQDGVKTRLLSPIPMGESSASDGDSRSTGGTDAFSSAELTRAGAVLGTPLYMSPEQCRGERLDARSDIYSIGVIAYQMLSGSPPFRGDFTSVMEAHRTTPPPPLDVKKVRRKLKGVILSSLEKDPDLRPQTAEAFASGLRARSEGIVGLLRRAGMIYTEHIGKFVLLTTLFYLPLIFLTAVIITLSFLKASEIISSVLATAGLGIAGTVLTLGTAFCATLITGTTAWIVIHSLAMPLRPLRIRSALIEARKRWKRFAGAGFLSTFGAVSAGIAAALLVFGITFLVLWMLIGTAATAAGIGAIVGGVAGALSFVAVTVAFMLAVPVVMMEGLTVLKAMRRSVGLVRRSAVTSFAAVMIMFLIPMIFAGLVSFTVSMTFRGLDPERNSKPAAVETTSDEEKAAAGNGGNGKEPNVGISVGNRRVIQVSGEDRTVRERLKNTLLESLNQIILLPFQIFATSFTAIIVALLYLKTRQAGGEPLKDLLEKFEETDQPRKKWQERVRQRLIQSGKVSGNSKP